MTRWGATQAKAHFSEVLDKAASEGPQLVERRKEKFIVLTERQLAEHKDASATGPKARQTMWEALRPPPERRFDFDFPRMKGKPRKVDF